MCNQLIHVHAPNPGGVTDYVDLCAVFDFGREKFAIKKQMAFNRPLPELCVLHYSGYGYAKRGAPLWLLNKAQADRPNIKIFGVFFHELYAFGPPWKSAFWVSPLQRRIARRLAEMSDFWITNREGSARWLRRFAGEKPHAVLPVFSNVGETPVYSNERIPKIVVFGSASLRMATYRAAGEALFSWAHEQGLELHDIGPTIDDSVLVQALHGAGVVLHGRLEAAEVSKQLSNAMFGVLAYPLDYVAKSGVFAAYCAHGVCPILISKSFAPADGLTEGNHYIAGLPVQAMQLSAAKDIGSAAWSWYQPHQIMAHVNILKQLLNEAGATC
ncbi:MAG: hypothetical protein H7240_04280 [Glaciimonas sp.]|nr:hypothetical protein [Glaciimonas sp.]